MVAWASPAASAPPKESARTKEHQEPAQSTPDKSAHDESANAEKENSAQSYPPRVSTIQESAIRGFDQYPPRIAALLRAALELTRQNLGYTYGSDDPNKGGMDCSGTIYYLLQHAGFKDVPRSASEQYVWARKAETFEAVVSTRKSSFELDDLKPGDLLFWSGTYDSQHDPPVTHTMIYLGKAKSDGKMLMVGSSDGRTYRGQKQYGVSVFDFTIPSADKTAQSGSRFVGYASIPGIAAEKGAGD